MIIEKLFINNKTINIVLIVCFYYYNNQKSKITIHFALNQF